MAKGGFPRGMGGGPNMNQMLKQAKKMQEQMLKMQEEMEEKVYEASSGGGAVSVKMNGKRELQEINLISIFSITFKQILHGFRFRQYIFRFQEGMPQQVPGPAWQKL